MYVCGACLAPVKLDCVSMHDILVCDGDLQCGKEIDSIVLFYG